MFEVISNFFKKLMKTEQQEDNSSKDTAKERLHLVLMQDRANVSVDFLEMMKQEIIDVIKKYIVVDEGSIDVRLTNQPNSDGTTGAPSLYANIPIVNIKNDVKGEKMREAEESKKQNEEKEKVEENQKAEEKNENKPENESEAKNKEVKSVSENAQKSDDSVNTESTKDNNNVEENK